MSSIARTTGMEYSGPAETIYLAEQLWPIRGQLYLGLLGLAVGGYLGLLQALERIGIDLYSAHFLKSYYQGLTIHGVLLAFLFTFAFSNSFLSLTTIRGFERPLASTWLAQGAFWTMLAGTVLAAFAILTNQATVLFTFYAPLKASSLFYLGAVFLVLSTWLTSANQLLTLRAWRREHPEEPIPLLGFVSVVPYLMWDLASVGVAILVVVFLLPWSLGILSHVDPQFDRLLFWFTGHPIVYFWLLPAYVSWYLMIPAQVGGRLFSDGLTRFVFLLFLVLSTPTGLHHQFTDPGMPTVMKTVHLFTTFAVVYPSFITAFTVMAALESGGRARGGRGLLGWIRALPWKDPSVNAQLLAMLVFTLGGATGIVNASYSVNLVVHNTAFVPGHFHMTVGTAVALTAMGICYWLIPFLSGRELWGRRLALAQAWLWAIGMLVFARGQIAGGLSGMPRRTAIGDAAYLDLFQWSLDNWLTAIGGIVMTTSGLLFFIVMLRTLFFSRPLAAPVEIPVAETVHGARESWPLFDRLGLWFLIAVGLAVVAYVPVILGYLPLNPVSPPIRVY
ncbi:cbb3-type cytochrome c oxidase subunit I [Thermomicrobiaceae bacterium CFH 74404]|uniref:Cbb3-type cytochrome c oxidase subunit I n=1 Tax=Thermalbibacter longus TaxID=2951981 RepID=A0AA41WFH1_9BACT|nr:cbb3-type cytochrome c oxidase subunit I [Thermalbibacter longus]MCM8749090.1 cbb3-type cytochrome c oxidase subunit I [Thermalbibacter longus]